MAAPSRRVIAEVAYGRYAQRKAVLDAGQKLVIGADVPSQFIVAKDRMLSKTHFELSWRDGSCWLRDLGSVTGTLLDGELVKEGAVAHGCWIRAGRTDFMVYYEHATPPVSDDGRRPEPDSEEVRLLKRQALERLTSVHEPLYAVLDAARARYIRILLRESVESYQSLYDGLAGEDLAEVAPYLVRLPAESQLLRRLVEHGWGNRWGVYLTSKKRFEDVRRHLRRFLLVTNHSTKKRLYFRYYDPDALSVFMQVATPEQREAFGDGICVVALGEPNAALQWRSGNA